MISVIVRIQPLGCEEFVLGRFYYNIILQLIFLYHLLFYYCLQQDTLYSLTKRKTNLSRSFITRKYIDAKLQIERQRNCERKVLKSSHFTIT